MKGMFIKSVIVLSLLATACSNKEPKQTTYTQLSDLFIETHEDNGIIIPFLWHADRECPNIVHKDLSLLPGDAYLEQLDRDLQFIARDDSCPYVYESKYIPKYCNVCMQGSKSKVIGDPMQDKSCATSQDKEPK